MLLARGLAKTYRARRLWRAEAAVGALAEVDLHVGPGETLGILGESGSGKSTLACCIARLQGLDKGELSLDGNDVRRLDAPALGGRVQMIFQDPQRALNPRSKVGESLIECALNLGVARGVAVRRAQALLHQVGLPAAAMERYPHAFSGGQSQRLCIARALVSRPRLLIADEAVSALGMSVQAQVLELLERVQQEHGLSMIFITHDLLAAARICHRFVVMQAGRVVEQGPVAEVYARPGHRYTQALLQATGALA
ncbi:MAG: ABC transporter ATP-binding protein [Achromobacter sp.]